LDLNFLANDFANGLATVIHRSCQPTPSGENNLEVPGLEFEEDPLICEFEHDDVGLLMKGMKYHSIRDLEKPGPGPTGNPVGQGEVAIMKEYAEQRIMQLENGHESNPNTDRPDPRPNSMKSTKRDVLIHKKYDKMKACLGYTDEDYNGASPEKRITMGSGPVCGDLKLKLFNTLKGVNEVTPRARMVASIKASRRESDRSGGLAENSGNLRGQKSQSRHSHGGDSGPMKSGEFGS
jgi:hypothetical protein